MKPIADQKGLEVGGKYVLEDYIGCGKIGSVYRAKNKNLEQDVVACKLIPPTRLRAGWERELQKLALLRQIPYVAHYRDHSTCMGLDKTPYVYVLYDYIDGENLAEYLQRTQVSIANIEWLLD